MDRWSIKGSDKAIKQRFAQIKSEYDQRRDERVTEERALELLMDDVDVEPLVDYDRIKQIVDEANDEQTDVLTSGRR